MKRNLLKTLCVAIIATFSAVAAWAVTKYPLKIAGVQVTSENCNNLASIEGVSLSGSGFDEFKYVPKSNTLIMKGVRTVDLAEAALLYSGDEKLTVQVRGGNQLNSQVCFDGPAIIEGDGLLEINDTRGYPALLCQKDVYIKDCKIKVSGKWGIKSFMNDLVFDKAVVVADGSEAAVCFEGQYLIVNEIWSIGDDYKGINSEGYPINEKGEVMKHLEYVNYDPNKVLLHEDFESGNMPKGWATEDMDGDGFTWTPIKVSYLSIGFHGSNGVLCSESWRDVALDPSNFLISPNIEGANRIRFHVYATDLERFQEHYWLTYTTSDDVEDDQNWEDLKGSEWTITEGGKWFTKEYDLPEGTKYVGFTHGWSKGQDALFLDDIFFFGKKPHGAVAVTPADEAEATIVGYYTIDGRRHSRPQSGVNIVKMSNGKAEKVLFP